MHVACPADRGAACVPRLNSPLAARVRPGRSCSVSCGRRGQAAADAQPALDEVAANASSPSARCVRLGHFPLPPRAARRGPHSGRRQRIGREPAMAEASPSRACDGRSWRCAQRACARGCPRVPLTPAASGGPPGNRGRPPERAVLRPLLCYDQDDYRARIVACQTVVCRSRRVARAARPLLLRGRACTEAVAFAPSAAERHNSACAGAGRPPRKALISHQKPSKP